MTLYKKRLSILFIVASFLLSISAWAQKAKTIEADICIYGGTSAGVIAAYTAKEMGKTVVLITPGRRLGGMSSGGLGYTDIGNKYVVTGLARDFYRRIGEHYGKFEQWIFEPKVAEGIFNDYVEEAGFPVLFESRIIAVKKKKNVLKEITLENANQQNAPPTIVQAKMFMDCTYEGDLMAYAGVSYVVGREANSQFGETINGVQLMEGHQFPDGISPYVIPGDPESGLLWGISDTPLKEEGSGDKKVQAYNFRITLTNVPENRIPITEPENYDPSKYELLIRLKEKQPWKALKDIFIWSLMPNGKTDINNRGGFSTDMIGMNWEYPEADYDERAKIIKQHEEYTKGLLYFVGNDPRIPEHIRNEMKKWGYPKDEYPDNNNFTPQLYVREARRMVGELVMTQDHCEGKKVVEDGIGMAAYTMDSHNCDRQVIGGMVKNEGNVEVGGFPPYPISYRSIVPQQKEAANLFVPVCLSASHIAFGSIRMEPVFMVLGQSSAVAACLAIDEEIPVQEVDVEVVQSILSQNPLADGSTAEILVDNDDSTHVQIKGKWEVKEYRGYGPTYFTTESTNPETHSIRYIPEVKEAGDYQIYAYFRKRRDASSKIYTHIHNGTKTNEKIVQLSDMLVKGQTSGEWISLGTYGLPAGKKSYVEISDKNADGVTIADAVLFVPIE